ncbi:MAG: hypothetical protein R3E31_01150 [Chloroflexota bacterium]
MPWYPRWSPDGRQIAFLSIAKMKKQPQIYLIAVDGGEARPLTDLKGQLANYKWSPDGKQFVCNAAPARSRCIGPRTRRAKEESWALWPVIMPRAPSSS